MEEHPRKMVVEAMGETAETSREEPKAKRRELFKRIVSSLLALVTILGALVAWRANLASNESGGLDSTGLLAVQHYQETRTRSYIEDNEHLMAFTDYVRNRKLALAAGLDLLDLPNLTQDQQNQLYRQFTEGMDLAATSERYFFPGRYLNYSEEKGDYYDSNKEIQEAFAAAEHDQDLYPEKSFQRSDELSSKVMGLLGMLVVLATSLWLLAISEVISTRVKYVTALGGLVYLLLGGIGAFYIDNEVFLPDDVLFVVWLAGLIAGAVLIVLGIIVFATVRAGRRPVPGAAAVSSPPPANTANFIQQYQQPPNPQQPATLVAYQQAPAPVYVPMDPSPTQPPQQPAPPPVQPTETPRQNPRPKAENAKSEEEEPFKRTVTVLIATVALIASIVAFLQSDASNRAGSANRNVQQNSLEAQGENTYGVTQMSFYYGTATQAWKELDTLAKSADKYDDAAAAKRYRDARDEVAKLSPLLDAEHFDPAKDDVPNKYSFEAELYKTKAVQLNEESAIQLDLKSAWGNKADAYIAHLTLLAVSLALFGLALATSGFARYIFSVVALLMVGVTLMWVGVTFFEPVKTISDDAVAAYAKGYGLWWGGNDEEALQSYNDALSIEPKYANALYERGTVYLTMAEDEQSSGEMDKADENYDKATADYLAAIKAGRDDVNVNWNLGWLYYLQGKFDDAVRVDRHVMELDPTVIGTRLNLAIALLVQGKYEEAQLEYNTAIARVSDQVTAAYAAGNALSQDFWYYLDAGVNDLDSLIDRIDGRQYYYTEAPPLDSISSPDETRQVALTVIEKLKSSTAGFDYLGKPPEGQVDPGMSDFVFKIKSKDKPDDYVEYDNNYFPYDTSTVKVSYHFTNLQKGQKVLFKVYFNTEEQLQYRYSFTWQGDPEADDSIDIADPSTKFNFQSFADYSEIYSLPSGDYVVEMYVDYHLVRRGFFQIEYKPAETPTPETAPEATPDTTPEAVPEATPDVAPQPTKEPTQIP